MRKKLISVLFVCCFMTAGRAHAQTLNQEMTVLADKISKALVMQGYKNVAAVDFTDLQGQPTELGRFLSERLTVEIVSSGGVSMLDRANIKSILSEHKLTEEGLVNPANAKKLGEFAGVDAILIGNATALDSGIELLVKAVATESSKLVAAGRITFPKTADIQQLLNRGISSNGPMAPVTTTTGAPSYQDANTIATKDIGSLRVVLKSVTPVKLKDRNGQSVNGIMGSFEFINRETQRPITVAINAVAGVEKHMGDRLRTSLVDEHGSVWGLSTSDVNGVGIVGVGENAAACNGKYNPTEIPSLLQKQDEVNSNIATSKACGYSQDVQFIFGSTSQISPGQSVAVTMRWIQETRDSTSGLSPKFIQMNSEIVVGIVGANNRKSYSLQNLTFDRISLPTF